MSLHAKLVVIYRNTQRMLAKFEMQAELQIFLHTIQKCKGSLMGKGLLRIGSGQKNTVI